MIVCLCHRVSHHDIASAVRRGCATFDALQDELRVATGCGAYEPCARELHAACARAPGQAPVLFAVAPRGRVPETLHA
ncbi:(2Fe-2S)-binding protein [Sphaerotilus sp.]|uniref:(2Fe-2S)-binding protein n=1 Tax=Sphaerotilus sp. TaxID=2093942 RepID=UPI002ACDDB41|nr:(2Fe-2S)-binding protein [Sphaerotilus sp.]MDZ7855804.1 (2Fe-2S)-binding protein [Sphaerotilus sp.]